MWFQGSKQWEQKGKWGMEGGKLIQSGILPSVIGWNVSLRKICWSPNPVNVTFFGNKIFAYIAS